MTILDRIVQSRIEQVQALKRTTSISALKEQIAAQSRPVRSLYNAISTPKLSIIAECKKASPSKGLLSSDYRYLDIAKQYEQAGASAISVLTEPSFFMGANEHLTQISEGVSIPVLRKDFIFDPIQIYETRAIGADAILLICEVLQDTDKLTELYNIATDLGLECLVEVRNERQIECALSANASIIGVNNRNLATFEVDLHCTAELGKLIPKSALLVSESGIHSSADAGFVESAGANAILVGETLIKSANIAQSISMLIGGDAYDNHA